VWSPIGYGPNDVAILSVVIIRPTPSLQPLPHQGGEAYLTGGVVTNAIEAWLCFPPPRGGGTEGEGWQLERRCAY
jgi:hypothetical protein